ncbi:hypothetical protein ACOXXX_01350 [Thalassococcus sp. BH17M4-6]
MMTFLANTWPILGAMALVGLITYGALMPMIRAERRRQEGKSQDD